MRLIVFYMVEHVLLRGKMKAVGLRLAEVSISPFGRLGSKGLLAKCFGY